MELLNENWLFGGTENEDRGPFSPIDVGSTQWRDLAAPRPDFRGAVYQFLIGVLQTGFAPRTRQEWHDRRKNPPDAGELRQAFADLKGAFLLENEGGPAFMQDLALEDGKSADVRDLLLEQGSESGQHFNKPSDDFGLCEVCATQALLTLQLNAPPGGRGTRTSVRGGGPLTTLLMPAEDDATLWERLWLNVIPQDELGYPVVKNLADVLPWMGHTRRSDEPGGVTTTPETVHPLQVYWSMPRRIRFDWSDVRSGVCGLCGTEAPRLVRRYLTRHGGTNYDGAWLHPLSPYRLDPKGEKPPLAIKSPQDGVGYRYWLGLTQGNEADSINAARVVSSAVRLTEPGASLRLWAFGGPTDNMKQLCWYDSMMPLYTVPPEQRALFVREVKSLLDVATLSADLLNRHVKAAWFRRPTDHGNTPILRQSFWEESEQHFYETLSRLAQTDLSDDHAVVSVLHRWVSVTRSILISLFDSWAVRGPIQDLDLKRVVTARGQLTRDLNRSKLLKDLWKQIHDHSEVLV